MRLPFWYSFGIVQAKGGIMTLFLAVDGGGTGCRAALADAQGRILGQGAAGPANISIETESA